MKDGIFIKEEFTPRVLPAGRLHFSLSIFHFSLRDVIPRDLRHLGFFIIHQGR